MNASLESLAELHSSPGDKMWRAASEPGALTAWRLSAQCVHLICFMEIM